MLSLITSYLIQTGKCALPYIGYFTTDYKPAVIDIVNRQIHPPTEEIIFSEETILSSAELIKFIVVKSNIAESDAGIQLDNFCKEWKQKINAGEKLCFETLGCLERNDLGVITFTKEDHLNYYNVVQAKQVLHENAGHDVLVGDNQTTSAEMNKYYSRERVINKKTWFTWALVVFIIAMIILIYNFYNQKFSPSSIGNRSSFPVKQAGETYKEVPSSR